jgi:hypothetical protein
MPSDFKNAQRHFYKWSLPTLTASSAGILCRIAVPYSEMRAIRTDEDLSRVVWCDTILPNEIGYFIVYLSPSFEETATLNAPYTFIRAFTLQNSRKIVIFGNRETISESRRLELANVRNAFLKSLHKPALDILKPEFRATIALSSDGGYPTFVEICPVSANLA